MLDRDAGRQQRLVERRREVQAGGRRRGRAALPCVDGLIALGIVERRLDVGRQRRLAVARQQVRERFGDAGRRAHAKAPVAEGRGDLDGEGIGSGLAAQQLAAVQAPPGQDLPGVGRRGRPGAAHAVAQALHKEQLDAAAGRLAKPCPSGDDAGVVAHEHVARSKQRGQIAKALVAQTQERSGARGHEQARGVARFGRHLGDQLVGQVVVELVEPHDGRLTGGCRADRLTP